MTSVPKPNHLRPSAITKSRLRGDYVQFCPFSEHYVLTTVYVMRDLNDTPFSETEKVPCLGSESTSVFRLTVTYEGPPVKSTDELFVEENRCNK